MSAIRRQNGSLLELVKRAAVDLLPRNPDILGAKLRNYILPMKLVDGVYW
jgi:hypothetical protein